MNDKTLPELPEPVESVLVYADHGPRYKEPQEPHFTADQMRAYALAALAQPRVPGERWYLGSLNDGLFIANKPPSPCGTDIPPDFGSGCGSMVLNVTALTQEQAQAIVDAHNEALRAFLAGEKG